MDTDASKRIPEAAEASVTDEVVGLMGTGEMDRIARYVGSLGVGYDVVEDALAESVAKLLRRAKKGGRVENVAAYLTVVARNEVLAHLKKANRMGEVDEEEPDPRADPASEAEAEAFFRWLCTLIDRWENAGMKVVTKLFLEAVLYREPLSMAEARDLAQDILGETVTLSAVGVWKHRGYKRLAEELDRLDPGLRPIPTDRRS